MARLLMGHDIFFVSVILANQHLSAPIGRMTERMTSITEVWTKHGLNQKALHIVPYDLISCFKSNGTAYHDIHVTVLCVTSFQKKQCH